ncbi:aprataxin-like protein [[Candida] anglica]|uniref:Aprataxin-like protein n=1 Tax=[Candida] anglica TaxID=148631 RepID=A0ABP0E8X5_9ASCO
MSFRDALQSYLDAPEKHSNAVLFQDENVVIIKDLYPKASRHYLILPKKHTHVHPMEVFEKYPEFYNIIKPYIQMAIDILVDSLIEEGIIEDDKLKKLQFANQYIKAGIHMVPSLRNLHIHVITKDFYSPRLKNKKHYNSFNTNFFCEFKSLSPKKNIEELDDTDYSTDSDIEVIEQKNLPKKISVESSLSNDSKIDPHDLLNSPLICSYCGKAFANKFAALKSHLAIEYNKHFP